MSGAGDLPAGSFSLEIFSLVDGYVSKEFLCDVFFLSIERMHSAFNLD